MRRIPVVVEVNGNFSNLYKMYPRLRLFSAVINSIGVWCLRRGCAVITVTSQLAAWVKGVSQHPNVQVVPNGADTGLFQPAGCARIYRLPASLRGLRRCAVAMARYRYDDRGGRAIRHGRTTSIS